MSTCKRRQQRDTYQAPEDDREEVEVDRGIGEAPEHERANAADDGAEGHEGRVGDAVGEVPGNNLTHRSGGVKQGEDNRGGELIRQRPSEHRDVKRNWEVREPLQDICERLAWAKRERPARNGVSRGRLTKVKKSGVRKKLKSLGISLGRRLMALYLGTGRRALIPNNAIPEQSALMTAHIRSVQANPTLFNRAFRKNGKTKPVAMSPVSLVSSNKRMSE